MSHSMEFKMKKHYLISAAIALLAIAATAGIMYYIYNIQAVATVNNERITKNELFQAMNAQGGKNILDHLIANRLLQQEAKRLGLQVTEEEIDEEINRYIEEELFGDKDYFYKMLEQQGYSIELVRGDIRVELLSRKIIRQTNSFSEAEIRDYFEKNQKEFNIPEMFEARHILVESREKAEEIIKQLASGGDFATLAKEQSTDMGTRNNGGDLGSFPRGKMVAAFQAAVESLKVGERSGPVETSFGFHVIELTGHTEAKEVIFDEVKDEVEEALWQAMDSNFRQQLYNILFDKANIKTYL